MTVASAIIQLLIFAPVVAGFALLALPLRRSVHKPAHCVVAGFALLPLPLRLSVHKPAHC